MRENSDQAKLDRVTNWEDLAERARYDPWLLAQGCAVSPRTLQRFFRVRFSSTPRQFLLLVRQMKAEKLAQQAARTKEIAGILHYKQPSHFCRHFKETHGVSFRGWAKAPAARHSVSLA